MQSKEPWVPDPRLDPFRDAVWELSRDGVVIGYLTSEVTPMRSFPLFWVKREWLWYQVHWLDGRREQPDEDYGPEWYAVAQLERGIFIPHPDEAALDARRVQGEDRDGLWALYGPPRF